MKAGSTNAASNSDIARELRQLLDRILPNIATEGDVVTITDGERTFKVLSENTAKSGSNVTFR
jgi:hypothetical protein